MTCSPNGIDPTEPKRAEEALREEGLRESEYKLRQIIDTVPGLIWSTGPDGEPTHVSRRLLDYSGMRFEEFKHRGWEAFVHPDDFPETAKAYDHALQTGTSYHGVSRLRRADGEYRWHHIRAEPLRDRQERIIQWYGLSVDIDEAKKAADRLRRSEAHLAEAQRLSHSGVSVHNETTILYGSEETYRIWGFNPAQGIPSLKAVRQRIHPGDRDRMRAEVQRALGEKRGYSIAYRIVLPDGTVKHLESIGQPEFSASGELVEIVATQMDVTERKRSEEALRESEYKLRQIIETVPSHLWSADSNFEPTHLNQHLLDYFGRRFEEFKHGGWEAFIHPDDLPETAKALSHAVQTGTYFQVVHRLRRADGEFRWHHARGEPLRDQQGRIIQWYGLSVDIDEAKKAEDRLRRSEAYLAEAQRLSHTGTWVLNPTTMQYLYWSDESYRIWGFDPLQGLPSREALWQRIHDRDRVWEKVQEAVRQKKDYSGEFEIVLPNGTVKYLAAASHHLFSTNGEIVEVIGTNVDVTERKRAEQALRESETKFRDYAETASDWFWETGPDYRFTLLTDNAFGSASASRIGTRCWDHALDLETEPEKWRLLRATYDSRKAFRDFVYCTMGGNGSRMYVSASGKAVFDASGEFRGYRGTCTDVTEHKRAEQALRESEAKFRDYAETASDWFWEIGPDHKFTLLTENAFGSDSADRIGTACWDHALDLETEPEKWRLIQATLDSRKPFRDFVYCSARRNGSPMYVRASGKPVFDANGEFRGYRGTGTDVTALVRAQEEHERLRQLESDLAHTNRLSMMGELAASLAHEIAQPIATSRNNARAAMHFLERSPPDLGQVGEALACVVDDADRAGEILDRIRDHIKKSPPRKERVDLNQAINDVIALAQGAIIKNGVSVQTRLTEGLSHVQADCVQLQQVVLNLILNAAEAMSSVKKGARELSISTEKHHAGGVLVAVRDSGPGIASEHLDRVFDAFYTTKSSGVGMGLSICRSIINAHGGRLWADVNAPRGAVFQFTLPSAERELTNPRPADHHIEEPNGGTALDAPR